VLTGVELAVAIVMVTLGSVVLGTVSFGLGMVASPALLLLLGAKPTIVLINSMITINLSLVLLRTWRHLDFRVSRGLILGGLAAAPLGVLVLNVADPGLLRIIIGVVIVTLGLLNLRETQLPIATFPGSGLFYGFVTALSVTAISIGGPMGAVYAIAQRWPTQTVRAALAAMFTISSGMAVVLYAVTGLYTRDTLINLGMLVPGLLVGVGIASLLVGRLNERVFRYVVIVLVVAGGGMLLARELLG
jgi:uncharacterized membrane protein YfcA